MKISTKQFVMGSLVGLGLFAVLFSYQTSNRSDETFSAHAPDFTSLQDLENQNLLDVKPPPMLPDPELAAGYDGYAVATVETDPAMESVGADDVDLAIADMASPQPLPAELDFADSSAPQTDAADANMVQSFNYLPDTEAEPIRIAANIELPGTTMPEPVQPMAIQPAAMEPMKPIAVQPAAVDPTAVQPAAIKPAMEETAPAHRSTGAQVINGIRRPNWKKNPYAGKSATPSAREKAQPETPSTFSAEPPAQNDAPMSFDLSAGSATGASSIGAMVEVPGIEAPIETTAAKGFTAHVTHSAPSPSMQPPKPAAAPMSPPIIAGLDRTAATKAVHHIEYGKSLARRNALEAATQEFYSALHVMAQANDRQTGTNNYTDALRMGVTAMKEAKDFRVDDPQHQIHTNVSSIVEAHDTKLIGKTNARHLTATQAMQQYFEYAGQQLGLCGGQNVVAAEALYCLGKLTAIRSTSSDNPNSFEVAKAIIFHRASMGANSQNYQSANELGVLLAREGRLSAAEAWLKKSLTIKPIAQSWGNLAKVHQRKGTPMDNDLAARAHREYQIAMNNEAVGLSGNKIRWVEPAEFIRSAPPETAHPVANVAAVPQTVVPVANIEEASSQDKQSIADRIRNWVPKPVLRR